MSRAIVLSALAFAAIPVATAQAPCGAYQKLADAQLKGFATIKTDKGDRWFRETSLSLVGAGECSVSEHAEGDSYSCSREFDTEAKARAAASAAKAEARSCFPGWTARARTSFPPSSNPKGRFLEQTGLFRPSPNEEEPPLTIDLTSWNEDGKTLYHVTIGMRSLRVKPSQVLDASVRGLCPTINRIIASTRDGLSEFKASAIAGKTALFEAKFSLGPEEVCTVDLSAGSAYKCTSRWLSLNSGQGLHDERSAAMKACLATWKQEVLPESALAGRDRRLAGLRLTGAGGNAGIEVTLFLDKRELPKNDVAFDTTIAVQRRP